MRPDCEYFLILATSHRIRLPKILLLLVAIVPPARAQNAAHKPQVDALYKEGVRLLQQGDPASARVAFEKVVRLAPNAPEGHNSLGWLLLTAGKLDEAIAQLRVAVKLKPDFVQAHINLANALAAKKDMEGALVEARAAVKLAPNDAESHRMLGRVLSFRQDLPGAISEFRQAVQLSPARPDLRDELGALLHRIRNLKKRRQNLPRRFGCSRILLPPGSIWVWSDGSSVRLKKLNNCCGRLSNLRQTTLRRTTI